MSTQDNPKKPDLTSFGIYKISASASQEKDGIYGIAHCPICMQREEVHDDVRGEQSTIDWALNKVRAHMRIVHGVKDKSDA